MAARPFSRHPRADFTPATCIRSGRTEDLIDLGGDDIPGYGRVYLSTLEVGELATLLGFVDPAGPAQAIAALEGQLAAERARYATLNDRYQNGGHLTKLERLARDLRTTADDLLSAALPRDGDGAAVPVPLRSDSIPAADRPAADVDGTPDGDPVDPPVKPARKPRVSRKKPAGDVPADGGDDDLGTGPAADVDPEVDGPLVDASFGWVEQADGEDGFYAAISADDVGD